MQMWNKFTEWVTNLLLGKKEVVLDEEARFGEWYASRIPIPQTKHVYVFYFKNKLMEGVHEWMDKQSGVISYPYFGEDLESEDLYLKVWLTSSEYTKYCKLAKHCGGYVHRCTWRLQLDEGQLEIGKGPFTEQEKYELKYKELTRGVLKGYTFGRIK